MAIVAKRGNDARIVTSLIVGDGRGRACLSRRIENDQIVRVLPPARRAGRHARKQLFLLTVCRMFDEATLVTMHDEAMAPASDQHASVQDDPARAVEQDDMRPVIGPGTGSLPGEAGLHPIRDAEQLDNLIDQMRAQIEPDAASRSGVLAPAIAH